MASLPIPLPGILGFGGGNLLLNYTQARPGTEIVASSDLGSFSAQAELPGGLGPWVLRLPRVPSRARFYVPPTSQVYAITPAASFDMLLLGSAAGFDVSLRSTIDTVPSVAFGTACYSAIRLDAGTAILEVGRYRNALGLETVGIRSNVIATIPGDIVYSQSITNIRMAKSAQFILFQAGPMSVVLDTSGINTQPCTVKAVGYASVNYSHFTNITIDRIDSSPSVVVGNRFADASLRNGMLNFVMPDVEAGDLIVVASGYTFEDSTMMRSINRSGSQLPLGQAVEGRIFGDPSVR